MMTLRRPYSISQYAESVATDTLSSEYYIQPAWHQWWLSSILGKTISRFHALHFVRARVMISSTCRTFLPNIHVWRLTFAIRCSGISDTRYLRAILLSISVVSERRLMADSVGQIPYASRISGNTEHLPVTAQILGQPCTYDS